MNGSHAITQAIKQAVSKHESQPGDVDEHVIDCDADEFWAVVEKTLEEEQTS